MHTVIRVYSGKGGDEVIDLVLAKRAAVEDLMRSIPGFRSYAVVKSPGSGFTVTVCDDAAASAAVTEKARDWVRQNGSHIHADPPQILGGPVSWQLV